MFKYACSSTTLKILNFHNKIPKIFVFYMFSLECCLHPYIPVQDASSSPKLLDYDCVTLYGGIQGCRRVHVSQGDDQPHHRLPPAKGVDQVHTSR